MAVVVDKVIAPDFSESHSDMSKSPMLSPTISEGLSIDSNDEELIETQLESSTAVSDPRATASVNGKDDLSERDLRRLASLLIEEQDALKLELKYANMMIEELNARIEQFIDDDEIDEEDSTLDPSKCATPNKENWCADIWLPTAKDNYFLGEAEEALAKMQYQKAINTLQTVLLHRSIENRTRVNAKLLIATVYRICEQPNRGLTHAEEALQIADRRNLQDMVGKAQFYRGTCLFEIEAYADASWCFSLAVGTPNFAEKIAVWRTKTENERQGLPMGCEGRYLSPMFQRIPQDKGFGNADALIE
ncbi:MAG: hypothetical protein M4579_003565 [Chaenotheca gracillima]|nr:MAG: hypothetical protein M4579_003565 [Chaenotheca gracillima]